MQTDILEVIDERVIVPLAKVKDYLRITPGNTREDSLIQDDLIPSAIDLVEKFINRDILAKKRKLILFNPQGSYFNLTYAPISSVDSIIASYSNSFRKDSKVLVLGTDYEITDADAPEIRIVDKYAKNFEPTYTILYTTAGIRDTRLKMISTGILTLISALYIERDGRSTKQRRNNYKDWLSTYRYYGFYGIT